VQTVSQQKETETELDRGQFAWSRPQQLHCIVSEAETEAANSGDPSV
jgi:hypothetical protein